MPRVDPVAPQSFRQVALEPDDWAVVFLSVYRADRTVQCVGRSAESADPRCQAWLRAKNAEEFKVCGCVTAIRRGRRSRRREAIGPVGMCFSKLTLPVPPSWPASATDRA
jgi:hypothetical protein